MGKGDIKSRRGKISSGSYGVSRKRKKTQITAREFLEGVETNAGGSADKALREAEKSSKEKSPAKKTTVKKTTASTKAKEVPEEMKKVPKKSTTAKKAAPKK